ncbi:hypothetical protein D9M70_459160 [compost metagenome]
MPAGEVSLIEPAGEIWSVVTESPKMPSARAPRTLAEAPDGSRLKSWKKGGSAM